MYLCKQTICLNPAASARIALRHETDSYAIHAECKRASVFKACSQVHF